MLSFDVVAVVVPRILKLLPVYAHSVDLYARVHIADVPMAGTRHTTNGILTESRRKDDPDTLSHISTPPSKIAKPI